MAAVVQPPPMSAGDDEEGETSLIQMVTAPYRSRPDDEMNVIGLLYGAGLVLVLLPLLPFILLLWALAALRDALAAEPGSEA